MISDENERIVRSREIAKKLGISTRTFPTYKERLRPYGLRKDGQWGMPLSGLIKYIDDKSREEV